MLRGGAREGSGAWKTQGSTWAARGGSYSGRANGVSGWMRRENTLQGRTMCRNKKWTQAQNLFGDN